VTDETAINAQLAGIELNDLWDVAARFAARPRAIGIANPLPSSAPIRGSSGYPRGLTPSDRWTK
jgi:hypothetical protein